MLSFALLRGRCRSCGKRISLRYPMVEASTGLLFAAAAYHFGSGVRLASALVLIPVLLALAAIDLEHRLLPNAIVGPAAVAGLSLSVVRDPSVWWLYALSAAAVSGALLVLAALYEDGMGMGDVKMAGMLGCFLGPYAALATLLGAVFGAAVGGALVYGGRMGRRDALPFGAFLSLGALVTLFFGPELWGMYLNVVSALGEMLVRGVSTTS